MTGGASAGSSGFWSVVVLGMNSDGPWVCESLVFAVARKTERIVIVSFDELGSARSSVRIVTIKTVNPGVKMAALLKVEPLLVLRFGMGSRISPGPGLKLVIAGQELSGLIRLIILVVPGKFESPVRNAYPSRMALSANFKASFIR